MLARGATSSLLAISLLLFGVHADARKRRAQRGPQRVADSLKWSSHPRRLPINAAVRRELRAAQRLRRRANSSGGRVKTLRAMGHLLRALKTHDRYTYGHSKRVSRYARATALTLGLTPRDVNDISISAKLHDLGKLGVPAKVINGSGGLSQREWAMFLRHPGLGAALLRPFSEARLWVAGVLAHHERVDGQGYPSHLQQRSIPLAGRIIAVADVFDAMTSARSYNQPIGERAAVSRLRALAGKTLDATVVQAFIGALQHDRLSRQALRQAEAAAFTQPPASGASR